MATPLPRWLSKPYVSLTTAFGFQAFTTQEARSVLTQGKAALLLSRLKRTGWVERVGREKYRAIHPSICLLEVSGWSWRRMVVQRDRLPIVELAAAQFIEELDGKLRSLVLFGSFARGEASPESDIDLLLVADGLPRSYSERLRMVRSVTHSDRIRAWREYLWKEEGIYPLLEVIPLSPEEAASTHPFYLDMVDSSVVIFDRGRFMEEKLRALSSRLAEVKAFKVTLPSGKTYWSLAKGAEEARDLIL
jgi:uncharacterized protein